MSIKRLDRAQMLAQATQMQSMAQYANFPFRTLALERPDVHFQLSDESHIQAYCSLFFKAKGLAYFGHFYAENEESGRRLMQTVEAKALALGFKQLLGPLNRNTWFNYRFVIDAGDKPAFVLEPNNPDFYPRIFDAYQIDSSYHSTISAIDDAFDQRDTRIRTRLDKNQVVIRDIDFANFDAELASIYDLSRVAFESGGHFELIDPAVFIGLYRPIQGITDAALCKLIIYQNQAVGFVFSYIDGQRLIIKTIALKSGRAYQGAGVVMINTLLQYAKQQGCTDVVYALMRENNTIARNGLTERLKVLRRYALFSKNL